MRNLRTALSLMSVAAVAATLTACGGGSATPAASSTTPPVSSPSSTPSVQGPADPATATTEIKTNWARFFHTGTPRAEALRLLEDGVTLGPALRVAVQEQTKAKLKQEATVTAVSFESPTTAQVTYNLLNGTAVLLPNAIGRAVLQRGTWKVSKNTFCTLVQLGNNGKPVPSC